MSRQRLFPLLDAVSASDNGGRMASGVREHGTKRPAGGTAPTGRSESADPAEHTRAPALVRGAEQGGSHASGAKSAPSPLAGEGAAQHRAALGKREGEACAAALRSGKPWTLHADQQTRAILADCPERKVSEATAGKYRRAYDNLRANGKTAIEAASTRAHWDYLRTACRFCMEQDVKAWRAGSDRAMKRGDLDKAQRRTLRAFELAAALDEQFMQSHRKTWTHKAAELKAKGQPAQSKSKRRTSAPPPDLAGVALLAGNRRGTKVLERHTERLAVLALFGFRPAEMQKGVRLRVDIKDGQHLLTAQIKGVKVDEKRGQELRLVGVPVNGSAAEGLAALVRSKGGQWVMKTTTADYRSLNRALQSRGAMSCYTFRHQIGSELKEAVSTGAMTAGEAAQAMGHRSTASLSYYGSRSEARGGRRIQAKGLNKVRVMPVSYGQKKQKQGQRPKQAQRCALRPYNKHGQWPRKPNLGLDHRQSRQGARYM